MQSKENQATPPEDAPLLALTDKELAAISGASSGGWGSVGQASGGGGGVGQSSGGWGSVGQGGC
jgi:hypothetical protein